ncbi:MAG TPA: DegV family protein [Candidatus Tyrphobacter sp.]
MHRAVAVVVDSTSDIDPQRAQPLGITVVPLFVIFGDRSYRDYLDLSRADFYMKLMTEKDLPTTSQPTAAMFEEAFEAQEAQEILCLTISSHLSGTINSARVAAQHVANRRIEIFDSQTAAGGLGLMALRAAEMANEGATIDGILEALEQERRDQRLYACIPDLSHLRRTGRIGRAQAAIGTLMRIVPVLSLEGGEVVAKAQVRTFSRAQETMLDLTLASVKAPAQARFIVMHADAPELAAATVERLMQRLGGVRPRLLEVWEAGPVIATHGGPGAVGVCCG